MSSVLVSDGRGMMPEQPSLVGVEVNFRWPYDTEDTRAEV